MPDTYVVLPPNDFRDQWRVCRMEAGEVKGTESLHHTERAAKRRADDLNRKDQQNPRLPL